MSYLGRDVDKISNIEKLDNITFDGSSIYFAKAVQILYHPLQMQFLSQLMVWSSQEILQYQDQR